MSTVPSDDRQLITFCTAHKDAWSINQALIGVSAAQNSAIAAALTSASKSLNTAEQARAASQGATTMLHADAQVLRNAAADIVRTQEVALFLR